MVSIENLTINIQPPSTDKEDVVVVGDDLVNTLRIISEVPRFLGQTVIITDNCEQYGFTEGKFDLHTLLYFLADMLEV